jgi:hypothetical protein
LELKLSSTIPIQFEKQEVSEDSRFTKVKISLMHTGKNLNNSIFNKHVVEKALPSLNNIPIVGYISTDKLNQADFNGHEQKIVINKDGVNIEYLGRVYGIIPETNNATFEIRNVNGIDKEFLVCEGLLYNKFPEAVEIFERDGSKSQSMELESASIEGKFDQKGVYEFSKFKFEAACILGEGVTPAMTGSLIEKFSLSTMQNELKELLAEFNNNFTNFSKEISKEGGETVDKKLEMLGQFSQLGEDVLEKVKESFESYSLEDLETKLHQMSESEPRVEEEQPEETFEEVEEVIETEPTIEEVVEEEIVEESVEEVVEEFDYKSEYEKIKGEFDTLSENFTKVQEELTSLREFKSTKDKEEKVAVIEKFSELPEEAIKPFMENIDQYSKEDLELNLLAEVGKMNLSFSKKQVKKNGNDPIVSLTSFESTKTDTPAWFALVQEYKESKK